MEQPPLQPLNLHLDLDLGGGPNFTNFVERVRPAFPATELYFAGREQPLPVLIKRQIEAVPPPEPAFVDISIGSGNNVVYFTYDQSNLYLTAYKNRVDGPWHELTINEALIKPGSKYLMEGDYSNMKSLGCTTHEELQFERGRLEDAIVFLSTRDPQAIPKRGKKTFLKQCAKNLLLCIAATSEAVRFSIIAAEIGGYMDDYIANRLQPQSPLLILAWDRISAALINAARNPEGGFNFVLKPEEDFPELATLERCINAMGVLNDAV